MRTLAAIMVGLFTVATVAIANPTTSASDKPVSKIEGKKVAKKHKKKKEAKKEDAAAVAPAPTPAPEAPKPAEPTTK